jgi:hypothetical protein
MNEIQLTMAKQVNAKELAFAKFRLMTEGENTIHIQKGNRSVVITYNKGSDLYDVRLFNHRNFKVTQDEKVEGLFGEDLQPMIQNHFPTFEYVMEGLFGGVRT